MNIKEKLIYFYFDKIKVAKNFFFTKLLFSRKVRIIRFPIYIRGGEFINFGENLTTGVCLRIDAFPKERKKEKIINFGRNVQINDYVHIGAINRISIGNNVLIASKVFISDHNHGYYGYMGNHTSPEIEPDIRELSSNPVFIEDNVWIGELSCILPGVTIGKGSIIGAMTLVNKDIPPYSIAVGIPAKIIKQYNFEKKIWEKL